MDDYFKFDLLPSDIKTQVFSFVRFADWIQLLSKVCTEWRHLCKTTTLPKVLIVQEILPPNYQTLRGSKDVLPNALKLGQQYNLTGLTVDSSFDFKTIKKISKALPKLQWLQFTPLRGYRTRARQEVSPLTNSITHLDVARLANPMSLDELPPCFPNLQMLNYSTRVRLQTLQKMEHKFDKLKVIRAGILLDKAQEKKKRVTKKRRTAGENVGQLIEFVEAFKKVAPSLTELYMFWEYKLNSTPAELKQEFEAVEEAAASMGIKLYCRDLVRIMKSHIVQDPDAEFFMSCFAHNNLPYWAYTISDYTLLEHAIASLNVKLVRLLFERKVTNMDYELSIRNERNVVGPTLPSMTDSDEPHQFKIINFIPDANTPKCLEIVDILRENGYDVSKVIRVPEKRIYSTPLWGRLKFLSPPVRRLFENYSLPIKWFDKTKGGETIAHKIVSIRGTTVYIDLMEKQLTKEQICELMTVQDDKGNVPAHFLGDGSVTIIDRLIPYLKHCWNMKNKQNLTPLGAYLERSEEHSISLKEEKLRRFLGETPVIDSNDEYKLIRVCHPTELMPILPLLVEKGVNFLAKGEEGLALFSSPFTLEMLQEFKRLGVDLTITDDNGSNLMHAMFLLEDVRRTAIIPQLIEFLVKEGVNINQVNKSGVTPLMKAIQRLTFRSIDILKVMLTNGADPNLHGPDSPSTLIAVIGNHMSYQFPKELKIEIVKILLEHGAKPNSIIISGQRYCPLSIAITNVGSAKLVKMLIDHGADIKERDDFGNSMLHQVRNSPIAEIPDRKIYKLIDVVLNYIDVNDQNAMGETALHQMLEYTEFAEYLIYKGADINIRDNHQNTPMLLALDSVDMLLKSPKLDWLAINRYGKSALHILVRSYKERLKPFMEKFNAMPAEQQNAIKKVFSTNNGVYTTPLHGAIAMLQLESVKICVEVFGISPAMKNENSLFCFDTSYLYSGPKKMAKLLALLTYLLEHGADVNAQDLQGNTTLHCALKGHEPSLAYIKFLLDNGADVTIKNNMGCAPIDIMPSIDKLRSSAASSFDSTIPMTAEEKALKKKKKAEQEKAQKDEENEPHYDDEELEQMFNSDDMDENDIDEEYGYDNEAGLDDMMEAADDMDDEDEDDGGEDDDQDEDDDDDEDDDRLRKLPGGLLLRY